MKFNLDSDQSDGASSGLKKKQNNTLPSTHIILWSTRLTDLAICLPLLAPAVIALGLLGVLYRVAYGEKVPLIYKGTRLGINKQPFTIYKVSTLKPETEKTFNNKVLPIGSSMELPFGKFLRNTRLDELPQLFNVIKGDMSVFGPRPVRKDIYVQNQKTIKNYSLRFIVKPGILGPAQLFLPHSAPKKIRAKLNNNYVLRKNKLFTNLKLLSFATVTMPLNLGHEMCWWCKKTITQFAGTRQWHDLRKSRRISCDGERFSCKIDLPGKEEWVSVDIVDVNHETIHIISPVELTASHVFGLTMQVSIFHSRKRKTIRCSGQLAETRLLNGARNLHSYLITYQPSSPRNNYLVDQYVLKRSILMRAKK